MVHPASSPPFPILRPRVLSPLTRATQSVTGRTGHSAKEALTPQKPAHLVPHRKLSVKGTLHLGHDSHPHGSLLLARHLSRAGAARSSRTAPPHMRSLTAFGPLNGRGPTAHRILLGGEWCQPASELFLTSFPCSDLLDHHSALDDKYDKYQAYGTRLYTCPRTCQEGKPGKTEKDFGRRGAFPDSCYPVPPRVRRVGFPRLSVASPGQRKEPSRLLARP